MRKSGTYQTLANIRYFIPFPLPPKNPPFQMKSNIITLYGETTFALGQLNEMTTKLPDLERFIKAYVIKEALLSSEIEGVHTTLVDILTYQLADVKPDKNTQLVLNYTQAVNRTLSMLRDENLPLVSKVILQAHEVLMSAGEGDKASPGQYRKQAVRVGNLVPPPASEIPHLMSDLEKFINTSKPSELPPLIKTGLVHVQFETIHPFLDGNGRIGRLLIVLMLIENGLLKSPILYPSYYFKKYRQEYYQRLDGVRTDGEFEGWIAYFLTGIRDSARDAHKRAKEIEALETKLMDLIQKHPNFAKIRETARLALSYLFRQPVTDVGTMSRALGKSYNTTRNILEQYIKRGIVSEGTRQKRSKLYYFTQYLVLLEKEYA